MYVIITTYIHTCYFSLLHFGHIEHVEQVPLNYFCMTLVPKDLIVLSCFAERVLTSVIIAT